MTLCAWGGVTRPGLCATLRIGPDKLTLGSMDIYWYFRTFGRAILKLNDLGSAIIQIGDHD